MRNWAKSMVKHVERKGCLATIFSRMKQLGVEYVVGRELADALRHGYQVGIIMIEMKGAVRSGIHKIMPGSPLSIEWSDLEMNLMGSEITGALRYIMLLSRTDANALKLAERQLINLAIEMRWTNVGIGTALFPQDGRKARALLKHAASDLKDNYALQT
jgi:hypothetical protein